MTVCLPLAQINFKNLLGMDCINHLLNFLSWSVHLHFLLTINLLILHTVLHRVLLFLLDPFFLSEILRSLNTFMLWSANWNMMIPLIWMTSNQADLFLIHLTISALQRFGSFSRFRPEWRFRNLDSCSSFM